MILTVIPFEKLFFVQWMSQEVVYTD